MMMCVRSASMIVAVSFDAQATIYCTNVVSVSLLSSPSSISEIESSPAKFCRFVNTDRPVYYRIKILPGFRLSLSSLLPWQVVGCWLTCRQTGPASYPVGPPDQRFSAYQPAFEGSQDWGDVPFRPGIVLREELYARPCGRVVMFAGTAFIEELTMPQTDILLVLIAVHNVHLAPSLLSCFRSPAIR